MVSRADHSVHRVRAAVFRQYGWEARVRQIEMFTLSTSMRSPTFRSFARYGAIVAAVSLSGCSASGVMNSSGTTVPAISPASSLDERAEFAGVEILDAESFTTHTHTQLIIIVDGEQRTIPANVGIDTDSGRISALHTHDIDGVLHVESPVENATYTLDQFLRLWGIGGSENSICAAMLSQTPCAVDIESKDGSVLTLDAVLFDEDTITLRLTSLA